eukprot:gnl/TRDRNA2_/TRDRNA2_37832_c0_seq1.p2 gnl/TRDRNA2_/TRDRNA2_37832_c0~~gnl/TRDRNA2_/TRDRNA2_37832_c0_seq1.p2  ORF type:complete len:130 (+),score=29.82 gnl/TRDRNA2_/TRDRNA2_37832_c0_seq1:62-451(+)
MANSWEVPESSQQYLTDNMWYNQMAREWRCKWSPDNDKRSLEECQKILNDVVCPALRNVPGVMSVQRIVCGECNDFKIVTRLNTDSFKDWSARGFSPEMDVLNSLAQIDGVSEVDCQTYTIMPMFGTGK